MFVFFLIVAISLYAALHAYVYRRITAAWRLPLRTRLLLVAVFGLLMALPFAGRVLDHNGHAAMARCINRTAFLWMAWTFWFCLAGWTLGLWNLLVRRFRLPPKSHNAYALLVVLFATAWGLIESSRPIHRKLSFVAPDLPPGAAPVRIVQVSDVHLGTVRSAKWNRTLVENIRALNPDLLLSTGDFIDSSVRNVGALAEQWATLRPPLGKFAVLGNHEFYTGEADAIALHTKAGFQLLRGHGVDISGTLFLYGVDDPAGHHLHASDARLAAIRLGIRPDYTSEARLPLHHPRSPFTILMKHQPRINPASVDRFDLQLSGHTHGGQLFPFHLVAHAVYPLTAGLYDIGERSRLYVSRGTGTWGPPLRFLAPPEITVITLVPRR